MCATKEHYLFFAKETHQDIRFTNFVQRKNKGSPLLPHCPVTACTNWNCGHKRQERNPRYWERGIHRKKLWKWICNEGSNSLTDKQKKALDKLFYKSQNLDIGLFHKSSRQFFRSHPSPKSVLSTSAAGSRTPLHGSLRRSWAAK